MADNTDNISNELIYEILKKLQAGQSRMEARLAEHSEQFNGIRHLLIAMQSDDLRTEAAVAGLRVDMDTIKTRLNLIDPAH
jgi:flagellar capping protein FliD